MPRSHVFPAARQFYPIAIVALLAVVLALIFARNLIDFPVYYAAGRSLLNGRSDLYAPDFARGQTMDYRYPPFFIVALVPLWLMPYKIAAYLWCCFGVLEAALCMSLVKRAYRRRLKTSLASEGVSPIAWVLVALAVGQYYVMILHYGNAHLAAVALLFGSLYLFMKRKESTAALLISLAITIKLTPILLLPYFALKRRWKFLTLTAVFLAAINLAPMFYFGFSANAELLQGWYQRVVASQEYHEINGPINLSLKGQSRRYLTHVEYDQRTDGDTHYPQVNIASLRTASADRIWLALSSGAFIFCLGLIWRATRARTSQPDATAVESAAETRRVSEYEDSSTEMLELGLMICLMLLVGPLTSKIYFIALLWPAACLTFGESRAEMSGKNLDGKISFGWIGILIISAAGLVLPLLPGRSVQRLFLAVGVDFYVNLFVLLLTARALLALSKRETPARSGASQNRSPRSARAS